MVLMVVFDASEPYTSASCAEMSPCVIPRADSESTMSSIDPSRRCRLHTTTGSNEPARSRGTSTSTGPALVNTVLDLVPLRALPSTTPLDRSSLS